MVVVHGLPVVGGGLCFERGDGSVDRVETRHQLLVLGFEPGDERLDVGALPQDHGEERVVLDFVVVVQHTREQRPARPDHGCEFRGLEPRRGAHEEVERAPQALVHDEVLADVGMCLGHQNLLLHPCTAHTPQSQPRDPLTR